MAFERLEVRVKAGPEKSPASMTLTKQGGASRPAVVVSLKPELVAMAGYTRATKFNVLLGRDEDAGKLRLVADESGVVSARELKRTNAFFVNLGYIESIGTEAHKKQQASARVIAPGTVEIDIPDFDSGDADEQTHEPVHGQDHAAAATGGTRKLGSAGVTFNGVTIDLTLDAESVEFKGKSTEVTTRQAKLVRLLAKPRPAPVGEAFLVGALWDGKPPATAGDTLRQMAADLQKGLSPIGLNLVAVKGVGYQLKDL